MENLSLPLPIIQPEEIPSIRLYMDQVTTFIEERLAPLKRRPQDKLLTKTMINNYAKAQTPVGVPVGKLGHQVPGPALCLALAVNVLVYRMKGAAGGEAFTDGQKLLCGKGFRVLLRGIPGDGLCRLLKDADNGQIPAVRLGNQDLKGVLFTVDFFQKRKAGHPGEKYEIAQHGHG